MRKFLIAAVMAAVAIAGLTALATADEGDNDTSWTFSFSSKKKATASGSNSIIEPAKRNENGTPDDQSDDSFIAPTKSVIKFPKGSTVDTGARAQCKASPGDVGGGRASCPKKTRIGSGVGESTDRNNTKFVTTIQAYNQKKGILFVVRPCAVGTTRTDAEDGSCTFIGGNPIVLVGTWSKVNTRPTLTVPTPQALLTGGLTITYFQLETGKWTKKTTVRVNGRRRTVVRSYVTTPGKCKGTWKSSATETYEDGSKQVIPDSQTCKRG